jgi:chemotaxis protein CheD
MINNIGVGLGERVVSKNPDDILVAFGLGSCLGIGVYDPRSRLCGLMHAVLPERTDGTDPFNPKYVDSGILGLIDELVHAGASRNSMILRMAGGANMLVNASLSKTFDIGTRNVATAHASFSTLNIKVSGEQTGGNSGRTVRLYVATGRMTYRVIGETEKDL